MPPDARISDIAHVIQLSVAPVFLLTGIASLLVVLTNRLGRIIDRARKLETHHDDATGEYRTGLSADLVTLSRRARLVNLGISLFTVAALLVCVVISVIFVSAVYDWDVTRVIVALFVISMVALIAGLFCFLREVQLATASLRIGPH